MDRKTHDLIIYVPKRGRLSTVKYLYERRHDSAVALDCAICGATQGGNMPVIQFFLDTGRPGTNNKIGV
ncbi:unnamed protein product [Phytophthora lilii]|uniref:Unnamed protein product n=1 Tax=Phytophthora lilii TaxID=2077276 RepID=A0A9W6WM22_9STRA|nr:unnamed protein product [Phytophthora lilii]